mgnify:CR=1 FL=1
MLKNTVLKSNVNTINWLKSAGIRALKTTAQAAVGAIGASALLTEVDWMVVLSTALLSGVVSILTSIAGIPEVPAETTTEDTADGN